MPTWPKTFRHWWRRRQTGDLPHVSSMIHKGSMGTLFQPMVELNSGLIYGHEALVCSPRSLGKLSYSSLLAAAIAQCCQMQLEMACVDCAIARWLADRPKGKLFSNISAEALLQLYESNAIDSLLQVLRKHKVQPNRMGLDISGYDRVANLDVLADALRPLRAAGMVVALDDFKASDNAIQAWSTVRPDLIKMSARWTRNIEFHNENADAVCSLVRFARSHDFLLAAKSVESESELRSIRRLGVDLAQGYFLGSPDQESVRNLNLRAHAVLNGVNAEIGIRNHMAEQTRCGTHGTVKLSAVRQSFPADMDSVNQRSQQNSLALSSKSGA